MDQVGAGGSCQPRDTDCVAERPQRWHHLPDGPMPERFLTAASDGFTQRYYVDVNPSRLQSGDHWAFFREHDYRRHVLGEHGENPGKREFSPANGRAVAEDQDAQNGLPLRRQTATTHAQANHMG